MQKIKYLLFIIAILTIVDASAQRTSREHLRRGNKFYADSIYDKAEIEYLKSLENIDTASATSHYNLGNALLFQNKAQDAIKQYEKAASQESDKQRLAQIHHNMGVIFQGAKDYANAVTAYKQSLRENPNDDMTRYNLALAMHQLKNQQQEQQNQQEQEQQEQEQEQEQQEQEQKQQEEQQEKQQNQQEQEQQEQEMSRENAEQLLESAMQDEKEVQEKVKKLMQLKGRKLDKDW